MMRKNHILFPHSWMCAFPPTTTADNPPPPHLPKKSETRSELRKAALKHMFQAWMRGFFPPEFRVCSGVGSPERLPGPPTRWSAGGDCWSWFPSAGTEGKSRTDTEEVTLQGLISRVFVCMSEGLNLRSLSSAAFLFLTLGLFPAIFCWLPSTPECGRSIPSMRVGTEV